MADLQDGQQVDSPAPPHPAQIEGGEEEEAKDSQGQESKGKGKEKLQGPVDKGNEEHYFKLKLSKELPYSGVCHPIR